MMDKIIIDSNLTQHMHSKNRFTNKKKFYINLSRNNSLQRLEHNIFIKNYVSAEWILLTFQDILVVEILGKKNVFYSAVYSSVIQMC